MYTCEDYPCCGHTDGLGCDYEDSFYGSAEYRQYLYLHAYCDHATGNCEVDAFLDPQL